MTSRINYSVGGLSYDSMAHRYNEVPGAPERGMYFRPDFFTISTSFPGTLTFSRGNARLGRFASGCFVPATPTPLLSRSLGKYWQRQVEKTEAGRVHGGIYLRYTIDVLEVLLGEAAQRGHGATIVILDATAPPPAPDLYFPQHVLHGEQRLGARIRRCVKVENESNNVPLINVDKYVAFHSQASLLSLGCRKLVFVTLQRVAESIPLTLILCHNSLIRWRRGLWQADSRV